MEIADLWPLEEFILSGKNRHQLWIRSGFAFGFAVPPDNALFNCLCTDIHVKEADPGIGRNGADVAVDWPNSAPTIPTQDEHAPFLGDIAQDHLPVYQL